MDKSAFADPLVGRLLDGRYRVEARIARGGMATVYEATDLRLDRKVALKVMPHALSDDQSFSQRFVREARAAARLAHPNVVAVYDQGEDAGVLFLAMEYVDGRHTLRDVIRDEAPLSPGRSVMILEEILKALSAAHESGIVHRDMKPENVLISPRGQIKVADFGLARAITSATAATATGGVLMGTVSYLPPELVTDGTADARSDVYSLGVLLFEMLTGTKPHSGESPIQIAYKHVHDDVPAPSSLVTGIPPYLDALVASATSRHRDLRPADAHVMLQQLRRVRQALDSGVTDDPELTDDLTPTLAIHSDVGMLASYAGAGSSTGGAARSVDEVFDQELYADRLPRSEHTLIVGDPILPESLFGGSTPSTGDDRAASWSSPGLPDVPPTANPPPAKRKRRKSGWIAFVLVLLLAAAAGVGAWYYSAGRFQSTPNIISLSERAAQAKLTRSGLHFAISRVAYSETVPSGEVIATNPGPGDQVAKHGTVRAVISKGPERHAVPTVEGFGERRAVATIAASHLKVGHITRVWSEKVKRGQVISNSPTAGVSLRRDSPVALVVSRGPKPIPIHNYTGTPADNAQSQLKRLGFHVLAKWRYDDNVPAGKVIRQNPRNGNGHRGDTILLRVSRGPHLVDVPDVLRSGVDAAKSTLTAAGFHVDERQYTPYLGWGIVAGESPHGGQAPFGSTVIIYVL